MVSGLLVRSWLIQVRIIILVNRWVNWNLYRLKDLSKVITTSKWWKWYSECKTAELTLLTQYLASQIEFEEIKKKEEKKYFHVWNRSNSVKTLLWPQGIRWFLCLSRCVCPVFCNPKPWWINSTQTLVLVFHYSLFSWLITRDYLFPLV